MSRFKVGDKVEYIKKGNSDDSKDSEHFGQIGVVVAYDDDVIYKLTVKFDDGYSNVFFDNSFKLANESENKFKIGTKVRYVYFIEGLSTEYEKEFLGKVGVISDIKSENKNFPIRVDFPDNDDWGEDIISHVAVSEKSLELFYEDDIKEVVQKEDDFLSIFKLLEILSKQLDIKNTFWNFSNNSELDESLKKLSLQIVDNITTRIEQHQDYDKIIGNILDKVLEEYEQG